MTLRLLFPKGLVCGSRLCSIAIINLVVGAVAAASAQQTPPEASQPMRDRERLKRLGPEAYNLTTPVGADAVTDAKFGYRLGRQRIRGAFLTLGDEKSCLSAEQANEAEFVFLLECAGLLLGKPFSPENSPDVRWCVRKVRPEDIEVNHVIGNWTAGGLDVAVRGVRRIPSVTLRLTLSGDRRVPFREYSREALERVGVSHDVTHVDEDKLFAVLTTFFQCPFASTDDFEISAGSLVYEGVRFYPGRIRSRVRLNTDDPNVQPYDSPSPWADVILFVTDTEPQYVCLTFDTKHVQALEGDDSE